jgi:hypothetical protein
MAYKDLDPEETLVPYQIDIRNGFMTDAGNWKKRPGFIEKWDIGIDNPVDLLIPEDYGYGISESGRVFQLAPSISEYTGAALSGIYRPTWANHYGTIIICDGGSPVKITGGNTALLGGSPVAAKFVDTLDSYCLLAGHNAVDFVWSAAGNAESWPAANYNSVLSEGEVITYMKVMGRDIHLFKSKSIEVWTNVGGVTVFARKFFIEKGTGAGYSVVPANDTLYWFGDDGDFYQLVGASPKVISKSYRAELDTLVSPSTIYGHDFRTEGKIRWTAPIDGRCFVYDYVKGLFSEDNTWENGSWNRLPFASQMILNGKTYCGSYNNDGLVYEWSKDYLDDNGLDIRVYRRFMVALSQDGTSGRVNRLRFRVKRGVANTDVPSPVANVRWRFDQGDWTNYEEIDLGQAGDQNPYIDITNIGIGNDLEVEIVESDAVEFLITGVYLTSESLGR